MTAFANTRQQTGGEDVERTDDVRRSGTGGFAKSHRFLLWAGVNVALIGGIAFAHPKLGKAIAGAGTAQPVKFDDFSQWWTGDQRPTALRRLHAKVIGPIPVGDPLPRVAGEVDQAVSHLGFRLVKDFEFTEDGIAAHTR